MDAGNIMFFLLTFCLLSSPATLVSAAKHPYVVYMGAHSHREYNDMNNNIDLDTLVKSSHMQFLSPYLLSQESASDVIIHSYTKNINGFTAMLDEDQAKEIAKNPKVVSVFLNKAKNLHTTHSWDFMLLEEVDKKSRVAIRPNAIWKSADYGEDIIVANLDTGVWPESKSFSDEGYTYGPVPSRWKGFCENNTKDAVPCNKKLIGAKFYNAVYRAAGGEVPPSTNSARDYDGHGSHTLSTAGGNFVDNANVFGVGNGTAKGGSPRARVASYKVCWTPVNNSGSCYDGDMIQAMDAAINDGVDVLSLSLGGDAADYLSDSIAIGGFHAVKKGIVMVLSAGNSGPTPYTVENLAPWLITVAASTMDREFQTLVKLANGKIYVGTSLTKPLPKQGMYQIISADDAGLEGVPSVDSLLCLNGTLDPMKVKGKVLACLRGENSRVEKGLMAAQAGAVGMILCNDETTGNEIIADPHVLPTSHVTYKDGLAIFEYIKTDKRPSGYISETKLKFDQKPAPFMASFSSQGPNKITPGILKPDITAPGVNIIAAYTGSKSPTESELDKRRTPFITESGTSMSCPHVAGVVGLIRKIHPDWSPAAIKSAIMTTARTRDNRGKPMVDGNFKKATPFNYGAGHMRPNRAMDPGLVYDSNIIDHMNFLCAIGYNSTVISYFSGIPHICPKDASLLNYNYPSITVDDLSNPVVVTRTLKNVGKPGTYVARIRSPPGTIVTVQPAALTFSKIGQEKSYILKMKKKDNVRMTMDYVFGEVSWSDKEHYVRSPITVGFGSLSPSSIHHDAAALANSRTGI
ncbi:subtilisin-like protease SBT5.4 [Impatiens glandulifera]|uniref:subtilisin-like protease SBT5.4 n=1 Tax=Impatiens glandulifera TaxID=253017 RepID=UPI001FB06DFE|nr:subtilisin-like protease SBT5.4 [Impatiens glandulifera]